MDTLPQPTDSKQPQQNFPLAVGVGLGIAFAAAVLWAVVTEVTGSQMGIMAVAVGYLVAYAVKTAGNGMTSKFGYLGAVYTLLGCVLGTVLSDIVFYAQTRNMPLSEAPGTLNIEFLTQMVISYYNGLNAVFYVIAMVVGYRFSLKYRR